MDIIKILFRTRKARKKHEARLHEVKESNKRMKQDKGYITQMLSKNEALLNNNQS